MGGFLPSIGADAVVEPDHYQSLASLLMGDSGWGIPVTLTDHSDSTLYSLTARNRGTGGKAFHAKSSADATLLTIADAGVTSSVALTASSTLHVVGAATLDSTLHLIGAGTFDAALSVGTTLGVTGAATLSSTLHLVGIGTFDAALNVSGVLTASSTVHIVGAATLDSTLQSGSITVVAGNVSLDNAKALRWKDSGGAYKDILGVDAGNLVGVKNTGATAVVVLDASNNVVLAAIGGLATNATNGFVYVPSCNGIPTGVPGTTYSNMVPLVYDRNGNRLYGYSSGAWNAL